MPPITPRVRCGLPPNPRGWLPEKKKNPSQGSITADSRVTVKPGLPTLNKLVAKSPIIEGGFEDLLECYSAITEDSWTHVPLEGLSIRDPETHKSRLARISSPSDTTSSVSEGSNMSTLSSDSGKSARRKNRIFPGVFDSGATSSPMSINLSLSSKSKLSEEAGLSNRSFRNQHKSQENTKKSHSPSSPHPGEYRTLERRDHLHNNPKSKISNGGNVPSPLQLKLTNTSLREGVSSISTEESWWDELDVLEAYSSLNSEQSTHNSYSTQTPSQPKLSDAQVQMKFNLMVSVSEEFSQPEDYPIQLASYGSLSVPQSANSDLSRYSVESP